MRRISLVILLLGAFWNCLEGPVQAQTYRLFLPQTLSAYCPKPLVWQAFGDSLTSCYFDSYQLYFPNCGYPRRIRDRLNAAYRRNFSFYNNGIGGEGTDGGFARFQSTLNAPNLHCVNPNGGSGGCFFPPASADTQSDLVLILEGVNDLGSGTPYDLIEGYLRGMVQTALQNGLQVILATIPPVTTKPEANRDEQARRIGEFNPRIEQIANSYRIPLADLYLAFLAYPDWENVLITDDGLHPNDNGFEMMADVFIRAILPLLTPGGCYASGE